MKMVSMKQEVEKQEVASECCSIKSDQPRYPYGLRICLDKDSLKKLGIKDLPEVGSSMKLMAQVEVVGVSMNESQLYGDNKSVDLQITDMSIGEGANAGDEE